MWQLKVEHTCIGSGSCQGVAPGHFLVGTDNRAHPLAQEVEPDEAVLDAAASCPVEAIMIIDTATGEVVDPTE